ncbi:hypothetical protein BDN67DRAFT_1049527 [Paxillus ammoniavirescens]|nr:hypothetical protein BDN67DRAFT_1049527 [Paxillus ammoniavirescens]
MFGVRPMDGLRVPTLKGLKSGWQVNVPRLHILVGLCAKVDVAWLKLSSRVCSSKRGAVPLLYHSMRGTTGRPGERFRCKRQATPSHVMAWSAKPGFPADISENLCVMINGALDPPSHISDCVIEISRLPLVSSVIFRFKEQRGSKSWVPTLRSTLPVVSPVPATTGRPSAISSALWQGRKHEVLGDQQEEGLPPAVSSHRGSALDYNDSALIRPQEVTMCEELWRDFPANYGVLTLAANKTEKNALFGWTFFSLSDMVVEYYDSDASSSDHSSRLSSHNKAAHAILLGSQHNWMNEPELHEPSGSVDASHSALEDADTMGQDHTDRDHHGTLKRALSTEVTPPPSTEPYQKEVPPSLELATLAGNSDASAQCFSSPLCTQKHRKFAPAEKKKAAEGSRGSSDGLKDSRELGPHSM